MLCNDITNFDYLRFGTDFINDKAIKALKSVPNGKSFTWVYGEILVLAAETDGIITTDETFPTIADQIAAQLYMITPEEVDKVLKYFTGIGYIKVEGQQYKFRRYQPSSNTKQALLRAKKISARTRSKITHSKGPVCLQTLLWNNLPNNNKQDNIYTEKETIITTTTKNNKQETSKKEFLCLKTGASRSTLPRTWPNCHMCKRIATNS